MDKETEMKILWRTVREALNAAARQVAVRIVVAVLAGFGLVEAAGQIGVALEPAPAEAAAAAKP